MIEELVSRCFAIRNAAHLAHWATGSYSEHVALGGFYDSVIDKLDAIVEAYQGAFGRIGKVDLEDETKGEILKQIGDAGDWISENRAKISRGETMIENMLDDLEALFSSTYYKLKFLK